MKIGNDVLAILSRCTTEGNKLFLPEQLERNDYVKVDKVLRLAGGIWSRKEKAHLFSGVAETVMENVILTGEITSPTDDYDFFPTPTIIADEMAAMLHLEPGDRVLEPSAGDGKLVDAVCRIGSNLDVVAVELNPEMVSFLYVKYADAFTGNMITIYNSDFDYFDAGVKFHSVEYFDKVIMNPPFKKRSDIRHVLRAFSMLKPGGKLVSVMPSGITFRQDSLTKNFIDNMKSMSSKFVIKELPPKSFSKSGTDVNTVLLYAEKLKA